MRNNSKIRTSRGSLLENVVWTSDYKPKIRVQKQQHNFYSVLSLEELQRLVNEVLGIK